MTMEIKRTKDGMSEKISGMVYGDTESFWASLKDVHIRNTCKMKVMGATA